MNEGTLTFKINFNFIVVLLLIFVSNDTFFFGSNSNEFMLAIPRYGAIFLSAVMLFRRNHSNFNIKLAIPSAFLLLLLFISSRVNNDTITITGIYLVYISLSYLVVTRIPISDFLKYFERIIRFFAAVSIFFEFLSYILPGVIRLFPYFLNRANHGVYYMVICSVFENELQSRFIRANSIFWEPGVFTIYISLALAYLLFLSNKKIPLKTWIIYIFAEIFTFSTAGYVVNLYLFMVFVFFSRKTFTKKVLYSVGLFFLLCLILLIDASFLTSVFSKITGSSGTTITRYAGIIVNWNIMKEHSLFGVGASNMSQYMLSYSRELMSMATTMNTNGILYPFAAYGVPFGLIYAFGLFTFGKFFGKTTLMNLAMVVFIFLLFFAESLLSPLPYILCLYGYSIWFEEIHKKEKELLY